MGNLYGDPVSLRKRKWVEDQLGWGIYRSTSKKDALIFIQEADDYTVREVVGSQWQDALEGYNVDARVPDDEVVWLAGR